MGSIHSAASLGVRLCLRRARKRPVRSGGRTASRIAAFLAVPSRGPNDSLTFYSAIDGTSTWNPETVVGPGTTYSAPSMILNGSDLDVAVKGPDNTLVYYWAPIGDAQWTPVSVGLSGTTFSAPSMNLNGNEVNFTAMGSDNSLWFYWALDNSSVVHQELVAAGGSL